MFFLLFFVNNLQYGFLCKYCAIDGDSKKKKKEKKHMMKPNQETKSYCENSRKGLDQIVQDFA